MPVSLSLASGRNLGRETATQPAAGDVGNSVRSSAMFGRRRPDLGGSTSPGRRRTTLGGRPTDLESVSRVLPTLGGGAGQSLGEVLQMPRAMPWLPWRGSQAPAGRLEGRHLSRKLAATSRSLEDEAAIHGEY